jgi:hypothetical protein
MKAWMTMKNFDFTHLALYVTFGVVLDASGHWIGDVTYWMLMVLFWVTDVRSSSNAYRRGLEDGGRTVKEIWGIK